MRKTVLLSVLLLFAALTITAQNNYAPAYKQAMEAGDKLFNQGNYHDARTYYVKAKNVTNGGNPTEAQKKIDACDQKIREQNAAEERRRREEAEAARRQQEERQREIEESNRKKGYMKNLSLEFSSVDANGKTLIPYGERLYDLKMDRLQPRLKYQSIDGQSHSVLITTKLRNNGKERSKEESVEVKSYGGSVELARWSDLSVGSYVYEIYVNGRSIYSKSFTIEKEEVTIKVNDMSKGAKAHFRNEGGRETFKVSTNAGDYDVTCPKWCSIKDKSKTGFTLVCEPNDKTKERSGECTLTAGGKTYTIAVDQGSAGARITVEGKEALCSKVFSENGGEINLKVQSNTDWKISGLTSNKWCKVTKNDSYIKVKVSPNHAPKYRKFRFDVQAVSDENGAVMETVSVSIEQKGDVALIESIFIPGLGQMTKGYKTSGALTLAGELALVGGGVTTWALGKKQLEVMRAPDITFSQFQKAQKTYNGLRIAHYSCWGAAAALYVYNLVRAGTMRTKHNNIVFYPTFMQTPAQCAPAVGFTFKF